jgi:enoyl-CoA hydratase/carnithine racemase
MARTTRRDAAMSVDLIIEGPVAKVVLNRPEKLNALTH